MLQAKVENKSEDKVSTCISPLTSTLRAWVGDNK